MFWLPHLLILLAVYSVGPGLFFLRRVRLAPLEKLVASVGLSFLIVYLLAFGWFVSGLGQGWLIGISVLCLVLTVLSARDFVRLAQTHHVRRALAAFGLFLLWCLLLLSYVQHFGGGTWSGDWLEQYQRTIFFLFRRPPETLMLGLYPVPARPPMMNLIAGSLLGQVSPAADAPNYDIFQLVYCYLNALVFLPCLLVAKQILPRQSRRLPWLLLLVLAASPMVAQNVTYTWTKLFTLFYVLLGTHLYLRAWRTGRRPPMVFAFASLCAGFLVHHSAGPYALFLGLHYAAVVMWRRRQWLAEAATIGVVSALILATWFGWSARTFGGKRAVASNSTITDSAVMSPAENARNIARNLFNTIVPTVVHSPSVMDIPELRQTSGLGKLRDATFLMYQVSLTFGVGSVGAIGVAWLVWRACGAGFPACSSNPADGAAGSIAHITPPAGWKACTTTWVRERRFWLAYVLIVFVVGVAVYGGVDRFGVAHICLQGVVLFGLALIAAGFARLPVRLRALLLVGLALDLMLGVILHLSLEARNFTIVQRPDTGQYEVTTDIDVAQAPRFNWASKVAPMRVVDPKVIDPAAPDPLNGRGDDHPLLQNSLPYWGDYFIGALPLLQAMTVAGFAAFAWLALRPAVAPAAATPSRPATERSRSRRKAQRR